MDLDGSVFQLFFIPPIFGDVPLVFPLFFLTYAPPLFFKAVAHKWGKSLPAYRKVLCQTLPASVANWSACWTCQMVVATACTFCQYMTFLYEFCSWEKCGISGLEPGNLHTDGERPTTDTLYSADIFICIYVCISYKHQTYNSKGFLSVHLIECQSWQHF